ncbi:MAG: histidine kinase dimerization/phospho-acceptor domain-containing protein, partial [Myxococcota bacterium]
MSRTAMHVRLLLGFSAVAGVPLIAAGLGFWNASNTQHTLDRVVERQLERALAAGRLEAAQLQMSRTQKDLVLARAPEVIEPAAAALGSAQARVRRAVVALRALSTGSGGDAQLDRYTEELEAYEGILDRIVPLIWARSGAFAAELAAAECKPAYLALDGALAELLAGLTSAAKTESAGPRAVLLEALRQVTWLRAAVAEAHVQTRDFLLTEDAKASDLIMANITTVLARFDQRRAALRERIPDAYREALARVEARFETWLPVLKRLVRIAGQQTELKAAELSVGPGSDRIRAMSEAVVTIVEATQADSVRARRAARSAYEDAQRWAIAALLVAVVVAVVAGFWVSASLFQQMGLEASAHTLAHEVETRRAAEEAALAASKAKSDFLAMMSHEVRTPLNGILGSAELLAASELSDEQRDNAQTIESCGRSLLTVLDDILDSAKIEAGKMSVETIPFDLEAAVRRTVKLQRANAEAKGLEVEGDGLDGHLAGLDLGGVEDIVEHGEEGAPAALDGL